jgi:hypothetical protein
MKVIAILDGFMEKCDYEGTKFCTKDKIYDVRGFYDDNYFIIDDMGRQHGFHYINDWFIEYPETEEEANSNGFHLSYRLNDR